MSGVQLKRLIYSKGQLLTSKDFEDQQEYHRRKLEQLVQRFPHGIVRGLDVEFTEPNKESVEGVETFKITEGVAIDRGGNSLVIGSGGLRIPVDEFYEYENKGEQNFLYLSLCYEEQESFVATSVQESSNKKNRIIESVNHRWSKEKNDDHIVLAIIRQLDPNEKKLNIEYENENQRIRLDAGIIEEEQLSRDIKNKLVTDGDDHDHTDGHGKRIPESGLDDMVQNKLVTDGDDHDHTDGHGKRIPESGP